MKFRDGTAPFGSSRDGADRAIALAREIGRVGPIGGGELVAAGLEGRSEPHAPASKSAGDHAHEDPVLAHGSSGITRRPPDLAPDRPVTRSSTSSGARTARASACDGITIAGLDRWHGKTRCQSRPSRAAVGEREPRRYFAPGLSLDRLARHAQARIYLGPQADLRE